MYTMIIALQLIGGFLLLFFGGDWLVDGGVALARRFRISPLVIGLTIVSFGTSAPELLVSTASALKGTAGIAMGNVIGSNIVNIGLVLGLTALICPIVVDNMKRVLANGHIMLVASALLILFSINGGLSRTEGLILFAGIILYTVVSIIKGRSSGEMADDDSQTSNMNPMAAVLLIILSCVMLAFGGDLMVDGATQLASALGVSDQVIGMTVVAFGTSLPELAASVAAALKKQMEISIGNIIGSNIFNIMCVLGVATSIRPLSFEFSEYTHDFVMMMAFSSALLLLIRPWRVQGKLSRMAGLTLLGAYIVYTVSIF